MNLWYPSAARVVALLALLVPSARAATSTTVPSPPPGPGTPTLAPTAPATSPPPVTPGAPAATSEPLPTTLNTSKPAGAATLQQVASEHKVGRVPEEVDAPTGDTHARILALALAFAQRNGAPPMSVLLLDLLAHAGRDPAMLAVYEEILRVRGKPMTEAVAAAVADGVLPANTDVELMASLILGPIAFQQLIVRKPVDHSFVSCVVMIAMEAALQEIVQRPTPKPRPTTPTRKR